MDEHLDKTIAMIENVERKLKIMDDEGKNFDFSSTKEEYDRISKLRNELIYFKQEYYNEKQNENNMRGGQHMTNTGWENHELEKEIAFANVAELLVIFKRENDEFTKRCIEFKEIKDKLSSYGISEFEKSCEKLDVGRNKIALLIAERLTDTKNRDISNRPTQ